MAPTMQVEEADKKEFAIYLSELKRFDLTGKSQSDFRAHMRWRLGRGTGRKLHRRTYTFMRKYRMLFEAAVPAWATTPDGISRNPWRHGRGPRPPGEDWSDTLGSGSDWSDTTFGAGSDWSDSTPRVGSDGSSEAEALLQANVNSHSGGDTCAYGGKWSWRGCGSGPMVCGNRAYGANAHASGIGHTSVILHDAPRPAKRQRAERPNPGVQSERAITEPGLVIKAEPGIIAKAEPGVTVKSEPYVADKVEPIKRRPQLTVVKREPASFTIKTELESVHVKSELESIRVKAEPELVSIKNEPAIKDEALPAVKSEFDAVLRSRGLMWRPATRASGHPSSAAAHAEGSGQPSDTPGRLNEGRPPTVTAPTTAPRTFLWVPQDLGIRLNPTASLRPCGPDCSTCQAGEAHTVPAETLRQLKRTISILHVLQGRLHRE